MSDKRVLVQATWTEKFGPMATYSYKVNPLVSQLKVLQKHLLRTAEIDERFFRHFEIGKYEGRFAVVPWFVVFDSYNEAVSEMLDIAWNFFGGKLECFGNLGPHFLRETEHKEQEIRAGHVEQGGGNVVLLKAQTGLLYATAAPEIAAVKMGDREFPLGLYEFLQILITHPDRFSRVRRNLRVHCTGDRCLAGGEIRMNRVPVVSSTATGTGYAGKPIIKIEKHHELCSDMRSGTASAETVRFEELK